MLVQLNGNVGVCLSSRGSMLAPLCPAHISVLFRELNQLNLHWVEMGQHHAEVVENIISTGI